MNNANYKIEVRMRALLLTMLLSCSLALADCTEIADSCLSTIDSYKMLTKEQDNLILKLTQQRNEAIQRESSGVLVPVTIGALLGAAAATILIGIRR